MSVRLRPAQGVQSEFEASQGCTEKLCLGKTKSKEKEDSGRNNSEVSGSA